MGGLIADRWPMVRACVDAGSAIAAAALSLVVVPAASLRAGGLWLIVAYPVLCLTVMRARDSWSRRLSVTLIEDVGHVVANGSLAAMFLLATDALLSEHQHTAEVVSLWALMIGFASVARVLLRLTELRARRTGRLAIPTLVVGAGIVGEQVVRRLHDRSEYGLRPVGFVDADPLPRSPSSPLPIPVLGGTEDLEQIAQSTGARRVILAFSSERDHRLVDLVGRCQRLGLAVDVVPRLYEVVNERSSLDHIGGVPLLALRPTDPKGWQFALKHALDRLGAAIALAVLTPILLTIALLVRASSPGPVLFRQRRVGRDGRPFDILKFRTMALADVDAPAFTLAAGVAPGGVEGVDRRTRIGRFLRRSSLDELPQLLNVLRGDMSFVGPRPERPEFVERFSPDVHRYDDRHRVKSGITGWAQVSGLRGQTPIEDRVEWDNHYIQNWSLRLDLRIMLLTIAEVLRLRAEAPPQPALAGVSSESDRTVPALVRLDRTLAVQEISGEAARALGVHANEAIGVPVTSLLIAADAETQRADTIASAVAAAVCEPRGAAELVVRPSNAFGVRLRARLHAGDAPGTVVLALSPADASQGQVDDTETAVDAPAAVVVGLRR